MRVELLVELDERLLGNTAVIEVPWDFVDKLKPFLRDEDVILLSSRDRRYRVAAGNVPRLYEVVGLLHEAMGSYLKRVLLN
jgi:hypothetical protein